MELFRKFFSAAIGRPIEVENPFIWKTKAEVIRSIVDHRCGPLIKHTVSCTRSYDITKLYTHCGCPIKGLKPAKSAAREAFEEAGIRGKVGGKSLGVFAYNKLLDESGVRAICE